MLEEAIKELTEEVRNNTLVLNQLVASLTLSQATDTLRAQVEATLSRAMVDPQPKEGPQASAKEPMAYPDDERRNARLDIAANYAPPIPEGIDVKQVPSVRGSTGLPEGERNKAYYDEHIRPLFAKLSKINLPEIKKMYAFYQREAEQAGRDFVDLADVPVEHWDEMYGRVKMELDRAENPESEKTLVAAAKAQAKAAEKEAASAADTVELPEGDRDVAYYAKFVRPHLQELASLDGAKMKAIVASYGVGIAHEIPSDQWENLILAARAEVKAIKAGA